MKAIPIYQLIFGGRYIVTLVIPTQSISIYRTTICPPIWHTSTEWGGQCACMCTQLVMNMVTN